MVQPLSPEELVRWCQRSLPEDPRPFEQLLAQYRQQVFATALRLMGNREDAEDQAQEVFLKVFHAIHDLEEPATLPAWLSRITVNTCLNALRRRQRLASGGTFDETMMDEPRAAVAGAPPLTPEQLAVARELKECIEAALLRLDASERSVLVLRELEDYSYQEIADTLRMGLSAVKMRIHRARMAFQRLFLQLCPGLWRPRHT